MLVKWLKTHCCSGHVKLCLVYMAAMQHHGITISFKNTNYHFARPSVLRIVDLVFYFFR